MIDVLPLKTELIVVDVHSYPFLVEFHCLYFCLNYILLKLYFTLRTTLGHVLHKDKKPKLPREDKVKLGRILFFNLKLNKHSFIECLNRHFNRQSRNLLK